MRGPQQNALVRADDAAGNLACRYWETDVEP